MKSQGFTIRLNNDEVKILRALTSRGGACGCNPSEFFRTMLWREWNKRQNGTSKAPNSVYSEMRIGRPKGNKEPATLAHQFAIADAEL